MHSARGGPPFSGSCGRITAVAASVLLKSNCVGLPAKLELSHHKGD